MNFSQTCLLLVCVLGLAGCKARAPRLELECTFDQDCMLTNVGADCCDRCESEIGTMGSVAARGRYCAEHPPKSCPALDCPNSSGTAFCEQRRCLKRSGIH